MPYRAPVSDLLLTMSHVGGLEAGKPGLAGVVGDLYPDLADDAARTILEEAGRVAETLLAPLDRDGDRSGARLACGTVSTPAGWPDAYRQWCDGGWNGISAPQAFGGMALPMLLNAACMELWSSANPSFALAPVLTMGAIEALRQHGSEALQRLYLPKLVSGRWTGTMNLTEPQAGSDVGALRSRAEPAGDGSYRITGQKIFITYGDHDLAENIVHLVLARLPGAPAGTRGISLFLVPKFIPDASGRPGARNDILCTGLEQKLGMHASPTCTLVFGDQGGATGWLIGEEHKGLACMFTMMNNARLAVGLQGVAAAERATQQAIAYARTRRQGRSGPGFGEPNPIVEHPDVARMLLTMQAETMAARAICHLVAAAIDGATRGADPDARRTSAARAALLTPVAKAYGSDIGSEVASLGIQVHGGIGYVEGTGAAQILRDVRIAAIYEGTNGIQAIDLATRKLPLGDGAVVRAEIAEMQRIVEAVRSSGATGLGATAERLGRAIDALDEATRFLLKRLAPSPEDVLSGSTAYLRLFAIARGGTALAALALGVGDPSGAEPNRMDVICRFFAEKISPAAHGLAVTVLSGAGALEHAASVWAAHGPTD